jgi:ribonuclease HI
MQRHVMPPKMVTGVINTIINAKIRYIATAVGINKKLHDDFRKMCTGIMKYKLNLKRETNSAMMFAPREKGGFGLYNPGEIADATLIMEFLAHINSNRHGDLAALIKQNYEEVANRIGGDFLAHPKSGTKNDGKYRWTLSYQVYEALGRTGWTIKESEKEMTSIEKKGTRIFPGGIRKGGLVAIKQKTGQNKVLETVYQVKKVVTRGNKITEIVGAWAPKFVDRQGRNIFGAFEKTTSLFEGCYAPANEIRYIMRKLSENDPKDTEKVYTRLINQLNEQGAGCTNDDREGAAKLDEIGGIGNWYRYDTDSEDITIHRMNIIEDYEEKVRLAPNDNGKARMRVVRAEVGKEQVNVREHRLARDRWAADKMKIREMVNAGIDVTAWTDGSVKDDQAGVGITVEDPQPLGDNEFEKVVNMPYHAKNIETSTGAELYAMAKIMKWKENSEGKLTIKTDSDSAITMIKDIIQGGMRSRYEWNHEERKAIKRVKIMIQRYMGKRVTEMKNKDDERREIRIGDEIIIEKVTSHTNTPGNERADIVAWYGKDNKDRDVRTKLLETENEFRAYDAVDREVKGNVYKKNKEACKMMWLAEWCGMSEQGKWVRRLGEQKANKEWQKARMLTEHVKWMTEIINNTFEWQKKEKLMTIETDKRLDEADNEKIDNPQETKSKEEGEPTKKTKNLESRKCHLCGEEKIRSEHWLECSKANDKEAMSALRGMAKTVAGAKIKMPGYSGIQERIPESAENEEGIRLITKLDEVKTKAYFPNGWIRKSKMYDLITRWKAARDKDRTSDRLNDEERKKMLKDVLMKYAMRAGLERRNEAEKWTLPNEVVRPMLILGVGKQTGGNPMDTSPLIKGLYKDKLDVLDREFGVKEIRRIPEGGTLMKTEYAESGTAKHMEHVNSRMEELQNEGKSARHIMIMRITNGNEEKIKQEIWNNNGRIIVEWSRDCAEMLPGDWFIGEWNTEAYKCERNWKITSGKIMMVMWENKNMQQAWPVTDKFWDLITTYTIEHTKNGTFATSEGDKVPRRISVAMKRLKRDRRALIKKAEKEAARDGPKVNIRDLRKEEDDGPGAFEDGALIEGMINEIKEKHLSYAESKNKGRFWMGLFAGGGLWDKREEEEAAALEATKAPKQKEQTYMVALGGQRITRVQKYLEDKLEIKKRINERKRILKAESTEMIKEEMYIVMQLGKKVYEGTRRREMRVRWEEKAKEIGQLRDKKDPGGKS